MPCHGMPCYVKAHGLCCRFIYFSIFFHLVWLRLLWLSTNDFKHTTDMLANTRLGSYEPCARTYCAQPPHRKCIHTKNPAPKTESWKYTLRRCCNIQINSSCYYYGSVVIAGVSGVGWGYLVGRGAGGVCVVVVPWEFAVRHSSRIHQFPFNWVHNADSLRFSNSMI